MYKSKLSGGTRTLRDLLPSYPVMRSGIYVRYFSRCIEEYATIYWSWVRDPAQGTDIRD